MIICFLLLLFFEGCPSPMLLQVVEVGSTNCRSHDNYLFFENDTLRVVYMFWGENGVMGIFIHNKTEYPLYIDWKKCSFITGTTKHDYWDESITMATSGSTSTIGEEQTKAVSSSEYWFTNFLRGFVNGDEKKTNKSSSEWFQQTFSNSLTRITKPERITFIPPHTTISQAAYNLVSGEIILMPSYPVLSSDTLIYFPEEEYRQEYREEYSEGRHLEFQVDHTPLLTPIQIANFDSSNSPVDFRSFITYSTDEKFTVEHYLDSKFYVARILELSHSAFTARSDTTFIEQTEHNMWASPSSFYVFTKKGLK